jgi:hypothetical protein
MSWLPGRSVFITAPQEQENEEEVISTEAVTSSSSVFQFLSHVVLERTLFGDQSAP